MKHKAKDRILSLLLSFVLLLSLLPASALAAEDAQDTGTGDTAVTETTDGTVPEKSEPEVEAEAEVETDAAGVPALLSLDGDAKPVTATVSFTAQANNAFLCPPQLGVKVSSDLAESYDYTDGVDPAENVSILDVMVAASVAIYGEEDAADYLTIDENGWVADMFGHGDACGYYLNDRAPDALATPVSDGDTLSFVIYSDTVGWSDCYTWLDADAAAVAAGDGVTLTLSGIGYDSNWNVVENPQVGLQLTQVDISTGAYVDIPDAVTDENGQATLSFDEAGTYYISAYGVNSAGAPIFMPLLKLTVTDPDEPEPTITVSFTLLGDEKHGENGEVHTLKEGGLTTWIAETEYTVSSSASVYDVLFQALEDAGLDYVSVDSTWGPYVSSINGLAEYDNGPNSGWMYAITVDGQEVYSLADGAKIVFYYTDDWTVEYGSDDGDDVEPLPTVSTSQVADIYQTTGAYILNSLPAPAYGDEWLVLGLARAGYPVPEGYYETYYNSVVETLKESEGKLSSTSYTNYSRTILALTAIGYDATDVEGYNLVAWLADYDSTVKQGINGAAYALIALDSAGYEIPAAEEGVTQTTRDKLISYLLSFQRSDGGWNWSTSAAVSDVDMTAMALQALAGYYNTDAKVKAAVDAALGFLSGAQLDNGGFGYEGTASAESAAQVIVALTALGIDPATDARFVKNGVSALDALCAFYVDGGGFSHALGGSRDSLATAQGYYALAAYFRFVSGQSALYDMADVTTGNAAEPNEGQSNPTKTTGAQTGDSSLLLPAVVVLWAAALGVAFLVMAGKRREN